MLICIFSCLYVDFHAPEHLIARARVRVVWAILRARHPLLASKVVMRDYADVSFVLADFLSTSVIWR